MRRFPVHAVVLNHREGGDTLRCLDALGKVRYRRLTRLVVDNDWLMAGYGAYLGWLVSRNCFDDLDAPVEVVGMQDDGKATVGILFGGQSAEHSVSIRSARSVVEAIDRNRFALVLVAIDRTGRWFRQDERSFASIQEDVSESTADEVVPCEQSVQFAEGLREAGANYQLILVPDAPHSFDLHPPQQDLASSVLTFLEARLTRDAGRTRPSNRSRT